MNAPPESLYHLMLSRKACYLKHEHMFRRIFKVSMWKFMDLLMGFDIVKFNDWLRTPDDMSTSDYIAEKHGDNARKLVKTLLGV